MKRALPLVLFALLSLHAQAQEKVFRFGPKAGLNVSDLTNLSHADPRIAFHAGMQFNIRLNKHWRLQSEVYYSAQGGRAKTKSLESTEYYNYLAFPLLAQYRFSRFYVEAGPQFALLLNGRLREYSPDGSTSYTSHHENIADFLIPVGAGYQLNDHFGFNLRYNQGITSIRRSSLADKNRNVVLQAGAFMFF